MNVTTIGIDLAKNTFSLHGVDSRGNGVFKKTLSRVKLLPFLGSLPPCLVGMEACSGAHYWGRELMKLGHRAGIMAPREGGAFEPGGEVTGPEAVAVVRRLEALARTPAR